jgi:hypothetical protein
VADKIASRLIHRAPVATPPLCYRSAWAGVSWQFVIRSGNILSLRHDLLA